MGRPKKWANDAERMASKRTKPASKRTEQATECSFTPKVQSKRTPSIWHPEIDQSRFAGKGRGVPVDGYVLISLKSEPNGNTQHGIVDVDTWHARQGQSCSHGLMGWSCKPCLPA